MHHFQNNTQIVNTERHAQLQQSQQNKPSQINQNLDNKLEQTSQLSTHLLSKIEDLKKQLINLQSLFIEYFYKEGEINSNKIMIFEVMRLSSLQAKFNQIKQGINKELVNEGKTFNTYQRQSFYNILMSDLMCLISISKFQLMNICLYGFDIYIGPFDAILDIVNRITILTNQLNSIKQLQNIKNFVQDGKIDKQKAIRNGFKSFKQYSLIFVIELNIYFLLQYLKKACKSLQKRDRQIIFTGCIALFDLLIPILIKGQVLSTLNLLTTVNFQLYLIHGGFDYFYFYTKIPVEDSFQSIFHTIKNILEKCLLTNTLTPFLFGILRNYSSFINFFEKLPNVNWIKYSAIILQGIIFSIKSQSFMFKQVMELLKVIIKTTYLSNQILELFLITIQQDLKQQWNQIDPFFRSAIKSGFNVGLYPIFHKLNQQQIMDYYKQIFYIGIINLHLNEDTKHKVEIWLNQSEKDLNVRRQKLQKMLQESQNKIDKNFKISNINNKIVIQIQSKEYMQSTLNEIYNILYYLELSNSKSIQQYEFIVYFIKVINELKVKSIQHQDLNRYFVNLILRLFKNNNTILQNYEFFLQFLSLQLQQQETYYADALNQILLKYIKLLNLKQILKFFASFSQISYFKKVLPFYLRNFYFRNLIEFNKKYIKLSFGNLTVSSLKAWIPTLSKYYNQSQFEQIVNKLYKIQQQSIRYIGPKILVQQTTNIKTLKGQFKIDKIFLQLDNSSRNFINSLTQALIEQLHKQNSKQLSFFLNLLKSIIEQYPIISYYILQYPICTKQVKILIQPKYGANQYIGFGNLIINLIDLKQEYFDLLLQLMDNNVIMNEDCALFLKNFINQNLIDNIVIKMNEQIKNENIGQLLKYLKYLSKIISRQNILNNNLKEKLILNSIVNIKYFIKKIENPMLLSQILYIFDTFYRQLPTRKTKNIYSNLQIQNIKYNMKTIKEIAQTKFYQHTNQMIFINQSEFKCETITYPSNQLQFYQNPILNFNIFNSSHDIVTLRIQDPVIQFLNNVNKQENLLTYITNPNEKNLIRFPELDLNQIVSFLESYFQNNDSNLLFIYNAENTYRTLIILLGCFLLQNLENINFFKNKFKYCKNVENEKKCLNLIMRIGYIKILNFKAKQLQNICEPLVQITAQLSSYQQPLISLVLNRIFQNNLILPGLFSNYIHPYIKNNVNQILYDLVLDLKVINNIQKNLQIDSIEQLSYLIDGNSENFRIYFVSLLQGMKKLGMSSKILNQDEYLKITESKEQDKQFEKIFKIYKLNWKFYAKIINQKILILKNQSKVSLYYKLQKGRKLYDIITEYYNQLNQNNLNFISNLKDLISKSNLQETLRRHAYFYINVQNHFQNYQKYNIIDIFKNICNLFKNGVICPNFIYHNRYTSLILEKQQFELPHWIQKWQAIVNTNQVQLQNNEHKIQTINPQILNLKIKKINLYYSKNILIQQNPNLNQIHQLLKLLLSQMEHNKLVVTINNKLHFLKTNVENYTLFKNLGILFGLYFLLNNNKFFIDISEYIKLSLLRVKMDWKLLKNSYPEFPHIFDRIEQILASQNIKQLNLTLSLIEDNNIIEFTSRGRQKRVNQMNRHEYCNYLSMHYLKYAKKEMEQFVNGFYQIVQKQEVNQKNLY